MINKLIKNKKILKRCDILLESCKSFNHVYRGSDKINYEFSQIHRNPLPAYITILKPQKNQHRSTVDFRLNKMKIYKTKNFG